MEVVPLFVEYLEIRKQLLGKLEVRK
jgi:hypothetical protein